jgi:hypothetical protein
VSNLVVSSCKRRWTKFVILWDFFLLNDLVKTKQPNGNGIQHEKKIKKYLDTNLPFTFVDVNDDYK